MAEPKHFDPLLLRTFLAVVNGLSFSPGPPASSVSVSRRSLSTYAASRTWRAAQLIRRDTRTVSLTDNGRSDGRLRPDDSCRQRRGGLLLHRVGHQGAVCRFGAADELALSELPTILREFRQLYPRINLELTVTQSGTLVRRLAANHLDLIFVNQPADSDRGRLVRRDRLVWVAIEAGSSSTRTSPFRSSATTHPA